MGRTLPSITTTYYSELAALSAFKHALKRSDQLVFDELFVNARLHLAEAAYAAHPLPMEIFLLAMLLEEHKEVMSLRQQIEELLAHRRKAVVRDDEKNKSPPQSIRLPTSITWYILFM